MRKQIAIAFSICLILLALAFRVVPQEPVSIVAKADGEGTIKIGEEEFKLHAVVVKLFEDGKAEINLITDIIVFVQGTWARSSDTSKDIDLKIGDKVMSNTLQGEGKLSVSEDRKSITKLTLEVLNKTRNRVIKVDFIAK
jgi:hypothetical protein